jgi:parvulin-like peptidyl-prolyl isomerase
VKRTAIGAVALVVLLAACSDSSDPAATVNGSEIADGDVSALVYDPTQELPSVEFAGYLGVLVQWTAIEQAAEAEFGIAPSDEEVRAEVDEVLADLGLDAASQDEFLVAQNISEEGLRRYANLLVIQEAVEGELAATVAAPTLEDAQQALDTDAASFTEVCSAHILVATEEEAITVLDRIEAGEAFADLAAEVSLDGSGANGGDLGCSSPAQFVPPFAEATMVAEIGEVHGPVESEFGFHVIVVGSRTSQTAEEIQQRLADQAVLDLVDDWMLAAVVVAEVEVAERHGTWVTEPSPQILPAA